MIDLTKRWYQGIANVVEGEEHEKIDRLNQFEQSGDYYAQPKCDGIYATITGVNGKTRAFSRNCKEKEGHGLPPIDEDTMLVGELGYGSQEALARKAQFGHDFADIHDILFLRGKYVGDEDELQRRIIVKHYVLGLPKDIRKHFRLLPIWHNDFVKHYQTEHEGIVIKKKFGGPHIPGSKNNDWYKVKHEYDDDFVIMDFELSSAATKTSVPMVRHLILGKYVNGVLTKLTSAGGMDNNTSIDMATNFSKYKEQVAVIHHYGTFNSGSVRHASYVKLRDDKDANECIWTPK